MILYYRVRTSAVPPPEDPNARIPGIRYAEKGIRIEDLGIACIVAYEDYHGRYYTFLEDNLGAFRQLILKAEVCVGHANKTFDNALLSHHGLAIRPSRCYDLLQVVRLVTGVGYGLQDLGVATFGTWASRLHYRQPEAALWQQGKHGLVISNALHDVWLLRTLVTRNQETGKLVQPFTNPAVSMALPKLREIVPPEPQ